MVHPVPDHLWIRMVQVLKWVKSALLVEQAAALIRLVCLVELHSELHYLVAAGVVICDFGNGVPVSGLKRVGMWAGLVLEVR